MDARRRMTVLLGGFAASQMLYVAARLRLADHLAHGPLTISDLASQAGAREEPLRRVVRALAAFGVFKFRDGEVANTPLSECLRAGGPDSVRDLALLYGEEHYHAMSELLQAVERGGSAFEHAYRKPHFSYLASNPDAAQAYYDMSSGRLGRTAQSLAAEYDLGRAATRVIDVGGGSGQLIRALLIAHPRLTGVVVDTTGHVARARARIHADGLDERCEAESGDILSTVPQGDLYLLGHLLHGMDDERALCVLRACERSATAGARVLVIEHLIPDSDTGPTDAQFAAISDVVALAVSGGRDRTVEQVDALLESAGLERRRLIALGSGDSVIEAVRAR
jgi:SAM-dependent methyltransferase